MVEAVTAVNRGMSPEEFLPIFHNAVHRRDAVPHTNSDFWKIIYTNTFTTDIVFVSRSKPKL